MYTLISTIGTSPAVLTEAVFALHEQGIWPVSEIKIITTKMGAEKTRAQLFEPNADEPSQWELLCRELGINPWEIQLPKITALKGIPAGEQGGELEDVRTSADDQRMAAYMQELVRACTATDQPPVIALLSGGRKTMSSHLMAAMQLFGRREDRLIHILVPPEAEYHPDFYFPTERVTDPKTGLPLNRERVSIDLIDIPFLRLRPWLEPQLDYTLSFDKLLAAADHKLREQEGSPVRSLLLGLSRPADPLRINGQPCGLSLPPRQLALLAFLLWRNIRAGEIAGSSLRSIVEDETQLSALHIFYRTASKGTFENAEDEARKMNLEDALDDDDWAQQHFWFDDKGRTLQKRSFSKERSKLWKSLQHMQLAHPDLENYPTDFFFQDSDPQRKSAVDRRYQINIPPKNCHITGLHPDDARKLGL